MKKKTNRNRQTFSVIPNPHSDGEVIKGLTFSEATVKVKEMKTNGFCKARRVKEKVSKRKTGGIRIHLNQVHKCKF